MKFRHQLILFSLLCLSTIMESCNSNKSINFHSIDLLMDSTGKGGWGGDIHFSVNKIKQLDTATIYNLQASYKSRPVGFELEVPKNTNQNNKGFGNGIIIKSIGKQSDDLRKAWIDIYKLKADTNKKFINKISVQFVDLYKFIKSLKEQVNEEGYLNEFKLFFQTPDGEEAEVYLNISKDQKIVELPEKDQEYRNLIIQSLTQSTPE